MIDSLINQKKLIRTKTENGNEVIQITNNYVPIMVHIDNLIEIVQYIFSLQAQEYKLYFNFLFKKDSNLYNDRYNNREFQKKISNQLFNLQMIKMLNYNNIERKQNIINFIMFRNENNQAIIFAESFSNIHIFISQNCLIDFSNELKGIDLFNQLFY